MKQLEFDFSTRPAPKAESKSRPAERLTLRDDVVKPFPNVRRVHLVRRSAEMMAMLPREMANEWFREHLRELRREAWADADIYDANEAQREYMRAVKTLSEYLRADGSWRGSRRRKSIASDREPCPVVALRARAG